MIGQTLSHYRITAALGAGGMGEVYRATDTKLGREVAIKVLPPEVAQDHERLERFRREAHVLASLNHPNIAAIYGLEEADGKPFLVLELVEGEDLQERLRQGPLIVEEAIETARQVAEGLEAAHEGGIIHRDLKPANVKLTPDGQVKVLDFGLAKTYANPSASGSASELSESPTLAHSGTRAGVILGTAAYMSPEQASGRAVDKRTDVWSFGALVFEMLTGRRPFTGETVAEILASILKDDPPWDTLPPDCSPELKSLLRRCLRKRSRERLHDIGDARLELEDLQARRETGAGAKDADGAVATATVRRRLRRERRVWATGLLVASGLAVALAAFNFTPTPEARPVAHLVIETPEEVSVGTALGFITLPSVSPDGRQVIFVGRARGSPSQLWIRPLDTPEVRALAETEGAALPFWSPDGRQIAFAAEGALKKLTLDGGRVERICVLPAGRFAGGTWNETGTIVFSSGYTGLYGVAAAGGEVQPLTTLDEPRGEMSHRAPQFLPDGRHVLFEVSNERWDENLELHVTSIEAPDEERRQLVDDRLGTYSSGYLLFVRGGTLFAQPFDPGRLEVSGEAVRVVENVGSWRQGNVGVFGTSPNGVLAYLDRGHLDVRLMWVNREGERLGGLGKPDRYGQISLSPDGRHVVTEIRGNRGHDLWVIDVSRGVASRATNDPVDETDAVWSPDGEELVFAMHGEGGPHLFRKNLRQGTPPTPLLETPGSKWPEDWSAHGDTVLYFSGGTFWALSLAADGPPKSVLTTGSGQDEVQLSPDGRWLAYTSNLSGDWETYVEPFQRPGERVRASMNGGGQPQWRADGRELFFVSRRNMLTAVPIQEGAAGLELGPATELFEVPMAGRPQLNGYGVASDGERFLVKVPVEGHAGERLHVVTDWTSLLE